jgi:hypothetical protein
MTAAIDEASSARAPGIDGPNRVLKKLSWPLVVRLAHHERNLKSLTLSLSKGEQRSFSAPS